MRLSNENATPLFLKNSRATHPERKRKIIGKAFIDVFRKANPKVGDAGFCPVRSIRMSLNRCPSRQPCRLDQSHHNVGAPRTKFELLEPPRLFKDEVRLLGLELGLPKAMVTVIRPGPGLGVRILGEDP